MPILTQRSLLLGLASWALPFAASIAFFDRSGQLLIAQPLFKSLMVVIGGGVGTALLLVALRTTRPTLRSGLALGLLWLAINLLLDIAILVPMSGTTVAVYLQDIGLRYLLLPIVAAALGHMGEHARDVGPTP